MRLDASISRTGVLGDLTGRVENLRPALKAVAEDFYEIERRRFASGRSIS
jgi:hypothetical protein